VIVNSVIHMKGRLGFSGHDNPVTSNRDIRRPAFRQIPVPCVPSDLIFSYIPNLTYPIHNHFLMDLPPSSSINIAGADRSTAADSNITGQQSASGAPTVSDPGTGTGTSLNSTETDQDGNPLLFYQDLPPRELDAVCESMCKVWEHLDGTAGRDHFMDTFIAKEWEDACQKPFGDALAVFEEALMILVGNPTWKWKLYNDGYLKSRNKGDLNHISLDSRDTEHKLRTAWETYCDLLVPYSVISNKELPKAEKNRWQMKQICCLHLCRLAKDHLLKIVNYIRPGTIVADSDNQGLDELKVRWNDPVDQREGLPSHDDLVPHPSTIPGADDVPSLEDDTGSVVGTVYSNM
jgi:hypothetical protein